MPRFVILEHTWNGVHWDLMLEQGQALRTWALSEPIEPGRRLLANALPDHRLAYLEYEGEVSRGRGSVKRWDQGEYEVIEWTSDLIRVRCLGHHVSGVAELRRAGGASPDSSRGPWWAFRLGNLD